MFKKDKIIRKGGWQNCKCKYSYVGIIKFWFKAKDDGMVPLGIHFDLQNMFRILNKATNNIGINLKVIP